MEDKDIIQRNMCLIMDLLAPATMIELWRDWRTSGSESSAWVMTLRGMSLPPDMHIWNKKPLTPALNYSPIMLTLDNQKNEQSYMKKGVHPRTLYDNKISSNRGLLKVQYTLMAE